MNDMTATRPRLVRDLRPGDEVAAADGSRVWTVQSAQPDPHGRGFLWRVVMTSGDRTYDYDRYHPDEHAPAPRSR